MSSLISKRLRSDEISDNDSPDPEKKIKVAKIRDKHNNLEVFVDPLEDNSNVFDDLKQDIISLSTQLSIIAQKYAEVQKMSEATQQKVNYLENQVGRLKDENRGLLIERNALLEEGTAERKVHDKLKDDVEAFRKNDSEMKKKNAKLQDEIYCLTTEVEVAERLSEQKAGEISKLIVSVQQQKQEVSDLIKEKQEIEVRLSESEAEGARRGRKVETLEKDCQSLAGEFEDRDKKVKILEIEKLQAQKEIEDLKELHRSADDSMNRWIGIAQKREKTQIQVVREKAALEKKLAERKNGPNVNVTFERDLLQVQKEKADLERKITQMEERIIKLQLLVASGEDELVKNKDLKRSLEQMLNAKEKVMKDKNRVVEGGRSKLKEMNEEIKLFKEKEEKANKEILAKNQTIKLLTDDLMTFKDELSRIPLQQQIHRFSKMEFAFDSLRKEHDESSIIRKRMLDTVAHKSLYLGKIRAELAKARRSSEHWVERDLQECQDYLKILNDLGAREREMNRLFKGVGER
ncbi:uncharacterized protein I206_101073 [Kwoniella pini CBS 10737]|uniref:Uncharacterized protein n=1 Tax=Kwoniella pini CBS 10737 TaxID=1296096 RepID=A0A1B9IBC8_9TREE|nr:uncharacterized protein I206_00253 [Kwoniella pini CBS 10737]OCF52952.1 hypothetical protein I206_00253 [Kwoniella pini CBS 10737]